MEDQRQVFEAGFEMIAYDAVHAHENTHELQDETLVPSKFQVTFVESPAGCSVNRLIL